MYSPASSSSSSSAASSPMGYSTSSASSSSSTRSSPVHAASLVDPARHPAALLQLVNIKLSRQVIDYVVDCVAETVDHALGRTTTRGRAPTRSPYLPKFTTFVTTVLARAEVTPPTLLTTLVYVVRVRPHLSIALEEWALECVFLGALITASKYTNDSTLKNVQWALCTGVFGKRDVGRIEREFLDVLDWDVPELEPSSPQSSAASMSQRTPASHSSPAHAAPAKDVPMDVESSLPQPTQKSGRFHALLRSFSLPRSHTPGHGRSLAIHVAA
ncbi:hypothetical protein DFH09DRAFT_1382720 [Mycena vulgaris]|nr:hypothetical protein DFH09DRAFT_1382720 [Mycena vulgaris]